MKANILALMALFSGFYWPAFADNKVWTGAGDQMTWTNAANWSGGFAPGPSDHVFITNGLGTNVLIKSGNISVLSLECNKPFNLLGGSLTVTYGASQISGPLSILGEAYLKANGDTASLTVTGPTTASNASFYAENGGELHFPALGSATNNAYTSVWEADGVGSLVDVSVLTNLAVGNNSRLYLQVYNGGHIDLHRLTTMTNALWADAQDSGSVVDLSGLTGRYRALGGYDLQLKARDGGAILVPNITQLERATVSIMNTGTVSTAQLTLLTNVELTVTGAAPDFGRITNIDNTAIYTLGGGIARLTNVTRALMNAYTTVWEADGAGSLVDVSAITNLAVGSNSRLYLEAYNGGTVDLHRLLTMTNALWVNVQNPESLVDLSGLAGRYRTFGGYELQLKARDGAAILVPNITQLERADLSIVNDGIIPTAQLTLLTNVTLTVNNSEPDFGRVTNIDDTSIYTLSGGIARLTNVTRSVMKAYTTVWEADGTGSRVDVSAITNLAVASNSRLYLQVYNGGVIDLHRLTTMTNALWVDAWDADSVVDLSGLVGRYRTFGGYELQLKARGGATVLVPNITQLDAATVTIMNGGVIPTGQLLALTNVTLTVDGSVPDFGRLTNIDDTSIYAFNGGIARLTNVTRAVMNAYTTVWEADGTGSRVDVSAITNLAVGGNSRLYLDVYNGGLVDLHRLVTKTNALWVDAWDANSVVDLSGLAGHYRTYGGYELQLKARDSAAILVPNITSLERATISIRNSHGITTAQLNLMSNVNLTVDAASPDFGRITNIDDTAITALNGGIIRLTNVARARMNAYTTTWLAENPGSLVDLSSLTNLMVGSNSRLFVNAYSGGTVNLRRLSSLSTGAIQVLADGTGSVVDFTGINSFTTMGGYNSSLTARNSGVILFNNEAFLLANVAINIPEGNPILPSTLIASPTLTLYGKAWHSYWIEKRDTRFADSPWVLAARVPLTTSFQDFAPLPPPNLEFKVWEFIAHPPIVDAFNAGNHQVGLVYYGRPDTTNQVFSAPSVDAGATWQLESTIQLTNSFRIQPTFNTANRMRFYQGREL